MRTVLPFDQTTTGILKFVPIQLSFIATVQTRRSSGCMPSVNIASRPAFVTMRSLAPPRRSGLKRERKQNDC